MYVHDDVRTLTAGLVSERCGRLPSVIVGSPPCQDASCANAGGKGVDGERTGLFFEAIRIVGECRPAWGCFENVPGLRSRGLDRVLGGLEAEGYAVWPLVMGADDFGAPHRRKRLWVVFADLSRDGRGSGSARRSDPGAAGERECAFHAADAASGAGRIHSRSRNEDGPTEPGGDRLEEEAADADDIGRRAGTAGENRAEACYRTGHPDGAGLALGEGERGDALAQFPPVIRTIAGRSGWNGGADGLAGSLRVADGLPAGMARACIAAYGDAIVPQIAEAIGRSMMRLCPTDGAVLDLFAGAASGWSLGMERAGYTVIAACEIDPWRRAVIEARNAGLA